MAKRIDNIDHYIKLIEQAGGSSFDVAVLSKCRYFLRTSLKKYIFLSNNENCLSDDEIIIRLKTVDMAARKIARAVSHNQYIAENKVALNISDTLPNSDELLIYNKNKLISLKENLESIIALLNSHTWPLSIKVLLGSKSTHQTYLKGPQKGKSVRIDDSLISLLERIIKSTNLEISKETHIDESMKFSVPKNKQYSKLSAVQTLTDAWCEITNKKPEKRKRDRETGKLYGEFHDFMLEGLKLFTSPPNIELAIKDACKYIEELEKKITNTSTGKI